MFTEYSLNEKSNFGFIEVICGSMFSGKTEELIRRIKKANSQILKRLFSSLRLTLEFMAITFRLTMTINMRLLLSLMKMRF